MANELHAFARFVTLHVDGALIQVCPLAGHAEMQG
jgi:hypothetical protein